MSWYSKKDVVNDVAHITGSSDKEIDEQYIVVGEQPPPVVPRNEIHDDEYYLRHGGVESMSPEKLYGPDLAGITEMLRMMDKFNESLNGHNKLKDSNDTILATSKLNPDIPEFIPRNTLTNGSCELDNIEIKVAGTNNSSRRNKYGKLKKSTEKLDSASLDKSKWKLSNPSLKTCLQKKTESNQTFASSLKLYLDKPENGEITENKFKLLTPQYFEKPCLNKKKYLNSSQMYSQSLLNANHTTEDTKDIDGKLIEDSVLKVKNWLGKKEKKSPKQPLLYLGPVTFRKKENVKPVSPSDDKVSKEYKKIRSYVPSEYANKLIETYTVRNKTKDDQSENIWSKLERELKAKDEIIKDC